MDCAWERTGKQTLRGENPTRLPEAADALATGKWVRKAGLILADAEHQWELTLQGDTMTVGAAALPEDAAGEASTPAGGDRAATDPHPGVERGAGPPLWGVPPAAGVGSLDRGSSGNPGVDQRAETAAAGKPGDGSSAGRRGMTCIRCRRGALRIATSLVVPRRPRVRPSPRPTVVTGAPAGPRRRPRQAESGEDAAPRCPGR